MTEENTSPAYTCNEYRMEMILLALRRRLAKPDLSEAEKKSIEDEIQRVKTEMGMA